MPQFYIKAILVVLHAVQAALSLEGGYHSYTAIINLQQYKDKAETAAKYSKTAEEQLQKTRTTEASGAGALLFSLITSLYLIIYPRPTWLHLGLNLVNLFAGMGARVHMANFWRQKTPIPLVQGFNTALDRNESVQQRLSWLEIVWLTTALVTAFGNRPGSS